MNARILVALTPVIAIGLTLILGEFRTFRRVGLTDRLTATTGRRRQRRESAGTFSIRSAAEVLGPLATWVGERASRALGTVDDTGRRLERLGSNDTVTAFRVRQLGTCIGVAVLDIAACTAVGAAPIVTIGSLIGAPVLAFLVVEQRLANQSQSWQQRLTMELPLISEQLGMLLSSGYSLGTAMARLAQRSDGLCADGLAGVIRRTRQGVNEIDALREWSALADVAALERLVGVLALNHEASDLGGLIAAESRSVRRQVQRDLLEIIEKRSQQVWIPVTVATLLPGVIFMAVPFITAMQKLTG